MLAERRRSPHQQRFWNHIGFCAICRATLEAQDPPAEPRDLCRMGANLWARIVRAAAVLSSTPLPVRSEKGAA